jgi:hypothetical protein
MSTPYTEESVLARYRELCAQRDAHYADVAPLEKELEAANAECEKYRVKAQAIAAQIDEKRNWPAWLPLKKEIAMLARFLSKPMGPLATPE